MARSRYQQGSVVKRGTREPMWYGRYWEPVVKEGKVIRSYRSERLGLASEMTEKQAWRALEPYLKAVNDPAFKPKHDITLQAFSEIWEKRVLEAENRPKNSSVLNFKLHLTKHILPSLGTLALDRINAEVLQEFVNGISRKGKTIKNIFTTLRMVLRCAWKWEYFRGDLNRILENVSLPEVNSEARTFTVEDAVAIISTATGTLQTYLWLVAETGLRSGELSGLRVTDVLLYKSQGKECGLINVEQNVVRGKLETLKSKKSRRQVPISLLLYTKLQEHIGNRKEGFLFITRNSTPWDGSLVVTRKLHPILKKLGIKRAGLHAFRHMNGSLMHSLNAPLKVAQERLGHSDVATTLKIYTHTDLSSKVQVSTEIGELLHPNRTQVDAETDVAFVN